MNMDNSDGIREYFEVINGHDENGDPNLELKHRDALTKSDVSELLLEAESQLFKARQFKREVMQLAAMVFGKDGGFVVPVSYAVTNSESS